MTGRTSYELLVEAVRSVLMAELGSSDDVAELSTVIRPFSADSRGFLAAARWHRVTQLVAPNAEGLGLPRDLVTGLSRADQTATLATMAIASDTARVSTALRRSGIPHLIFKGVGLSVQTTGLPFSRPSRDVDVLVDPDWVGPAVTALEQAGIRRLPICMAPESPLFTVMQRTQPEIMLLDRTRQVDLHWRLDNARTCLDWGFGELLESAEWIDLGGVSIPVLSSLHAAVLNAAQGTKDAWSLLRTVVDQVRLQANFDDSVLLDLATRAGAGRRLELAQIMIDRLLARSRPDRPRELARLADRIWEWNCTGREPLRSMTAGSAVRRFGVHLLTYDSRWDAVRRSETLLWPVEAMASRTFGDVGDRHAWLYAAATPYFLPKRLITRRATPS